MPSLNTLKVGAVDRLTPQSVVISIDVPNHLSSSYVYLPGQYITLELEINGNTVRRSYSICSSPNSGLLQVGIKEVPNGIFSTYVNRKLKKVTKLRLENLKDVLHLILKMNPFQLWLSQLEVELLQ